MVPPTNLDDLSHAELKNLVVALFEQLAELRRTNAALREEIARLKGGPRRPNIKPSGMEKATELGSISRCIKTRLCSVRNTLEAWPAEGPNDFLADAAPNHATTLPTRLFCAMVMH
jgi:hypothetical protein